MEKLLRRKTVLCAPWAVREIGTAVSDITNPSMGLRASHRARPDSLGGGSFLSLACPCCARAHNKRVCCRDAAVVRGVPGVAGFRGEMGIEG